MVLNVLCYEFLKLEQKKEHFFPSKNVDLFSFLGFFSL